MRKILMITLLAIVLAGCGNVKGAGGTGTIENYIMEDGTRCVVLIGAYKAAMDCDFEGE